MQKSYEFTDELKIIGANPYLTVPVAILRAIFADAKKSTGPIQVKGEINGKAYKQTLVKYSGAWRFYVNMTMLKKSPERIGESCTVTIAFDPVSRKFAMPEKLRLALAETPQAQQVFDRLSPSRQHEIVRYIARLKSEETVDRNIVRAIDFLLGKGRFVGRDKP
ncbi:hypothetical protein Hs30E_05190 [Lactococcus hodotermopsidis]|uniref:DUF1905 domain-containing protein n=1 Tax=Pseudolactococcus hodotermopsidis TaxID=2709157 RepID=A0A6A0BC80_9LACT|nr:YdeI/OmpD-associated family protein [Lactococcus hodotermopsidis]GFH41968.1 hypothetical protein Hs30E_05190 [Lactococcus hodotermopsidis]